MSKNAKNCILRYFAIFFKYFGLGLYLCVESNYNISFFGFEPLKCSNQFRLLHIINVFTFVEKIV